MMSDCLDTVKCLKIDISEDDFFKMEYLIPCNTFSILPKIFPSLVPCCHFKLSKTSEFIKPDFYKANYQKITAIFISNDGRVKQTTIF